MEQLVRQKAASRVVLDGATLVPEQVYAVAHDPQVSVEPSAAALKRVRASNALVKSEVERKVVYGVTTGFGPMASHIIGRDKLKELQLNLVRSHSVGAGAPLPEPFVLGAMVGRLNTFLTGYTGVSEAVVRQLATFINHRIAPIIPEHGAVGTSGDLVQLAHIALALIGEGEVFYRGKRTKAARVMKSLGIEPLVLMPKEGLSLINGTSMMTGIAALLAVWAERLVGIAIAGRRACSRAGPWLERRACRGAPCRPAACRPARHRRPPAPASERTPGFSATGTSCRPASASSRTATSHPSRSRRSIRSAASRRSSDR